MITKGFFRKRKEEYKDKIINCPDSPTGKAYVGINKSPFMPAKDNGHGYQGVVLQDDNRELVQCHSCGEWFAHINARHIAKCSGMTVDAYKHKYGINKTTGLISDSRSLALTKNALKGVAKNLELMKDPLYFNRIIEAGRRGRRIQPHAPHKTEFENKYGTCPLQLKTRLYEFIRCNRELPSQNNRGRPIYKALRRRYGEFGHALSAHGLPWMKRKGTNMRFTFNDGTVYEYNINQFYDREALFKIMMQKCPVLSANSPAK